MCCHSNFCYCGAQRWFELGFVNHKNLVLWQSAIYLAFKISFESWSKCAVRYMVWWRRCGLLYREPTKAFPEALRGLTHQLIFSNSFSRSKVIDISKKNKKYLQLKNDKKAQVLVMFYQQREKVRNANIAFQWKPKETRGCDILNRRE